VLERILVPSRNRTQQIVSRDIDPFTMQGPTASAFAWCWRSSLAATHCSSAKQGSFANRPCVRASYSERHVRDDEVQSADAEIATAEAVLEPHLRSSSVDTELAARARGLGSSRARHGQAELLDHGFAHDKFLGLSGDGHGQ
jgi:hypothetical protein